MFLAPAAMFAMFYYLSLYIQSVMGYSPLEAGFAFLPFCFGIVIAAGISSNLINRIDPRYPRRHRHADGGGRAVRLLAAARDDTDRCRSHGRRGATTGPTCFPFIVLMSFGMGLTFVPLTLTAVHHLRDEDSGIGSGVLNTMQQVGGALGLVAARHRRRPRRWTTWRRRSQPRRPSRPGAAAGADQLGGASSSQVFTERRDRRVPGRRGPDAGRLAGHLDLPQREARGARDRRPRGRPGPRRLIHPHDVGPPESIPGRVDVAFQVQVSASSSALMNAGQVVGAAAGDQVAVDDDLLVDPGAAGVADVVGEGVEAGEPPAAGQPGRDQQPRPVADDRQRQLAPPSRARSDVLRAARRRGAGRRSRCRPGRRPRRPPARRGRRAMPSTSTFWVGLGVALRPPGSGRRDGE